MKSIPFFELAVAFSVVASSACDDEILTDVDIPKDAAADRASDGAKEGATAETDVIDAGRSDETDGETDADEDGGDGD